MANTVFPNAVVADNVPILCPVKLPLHFAVLPEEIL